MATVFTCALVLKVTAKSKNSSDKRVFQEFNGVLHASNLAVANTMRLIKNVRPGWQIRASFPRQKELIELRTPALPTESIR